MSQPQGKRSRLRRPVLLLIVLFIVIAIFLLTISLLYKPQNNPVQPVINTSPIPTTGSINENVEGIEVTLFAAPEFNVGGTLTAVLACLASLAMFLVVHKKRSK